VKAHPTFGPQAEIDNKAQLIVQTHLEQNWTVRERRPDIRIDYEIEQKVAGEPTALTAYVQLKGQRRCDVRGDCVRIRLKSKDLGYWRTAKRPVMLIVTDVSAKKSRFLFLQEWMASNLPPAELERKLTHKVDVPLQNDLEDQDRFAAAIRCADRFMSDVLSTSPEQAIDSVERELAALDSRFEVSLTATRKERAYQIRAAGPDPVPLKLTLPLHTAEHKATASDVFKWGRPGRMLVKNAKFEGSPLFNHLMSPGRLLELRLEGNGRPGEVVLFAGRRDGPLHKIPGLVSAGPAGLAFTAHDDTPIRVRITMPVEGSEKGVGRIHLSADATIWNGQRLLLIPGLRDLATFTGACVVEKAMLAELRVGAITVPFDRRSVDVAEFFETLSWWTKFLADSADAAVVLGVNPVVPDPRTLAQETIDSTQAAINLARNRAVELLSLDFQTNETIWAQLSGGAPEITAVFRAEQQGEVNLLGCEHQVRLVLDDTRGRITRCGTIDDTQRRIRVLPVDEPGFRFKLQTSESTTTKS
jgi:hypothetical protein